MIFYHENQPGEVSHRAAHADAAHILALTFPITSGTLSRYTDPAWMRRTKRPLCAPGAMHSYLVAAAIREMTQGEG